MLIYKNVTFIIAWRFLSLAVSDLWWVGNWKSKKKKKLHTEAKQLNKWRKKKQGGKAMQRQSLTTSHQQTNAQSVPKQQLLCRDLPTPTPGLLLSMTLCGMEYPLVHSCHLSPPRSLPASCPPSAYSLWSQSEKQTAQQQLKHCCVMNAILVTNLKHSSLWAAIKKISSQPNPVQDKKHNLAQV